MSGSSIRLEINITAPLYNFSTIFT